MRLVDFVCFFVLGWGVLFVSLIGWLVVAGKIVPGMM